MTLFEAFPFFLSFLVSFLVVKYYSVQFGILQWVISIAIGCALFGGYVGVRILLNVIKARRESSTR
jgi:hypothetical protein